MRQRRSLHRLLVAAAAIVAVSCSSSSQNAPATPSAHQTSPPVGEVTHTPAYTQSPIPVESPVPTESSPPGDIPDNTQFVPYRSKGGHFEVKIPEGWSRTTKGSNVSFTDKLNTVAASWFSASSAPTPSGAKTKEVPELRRTERAFVLGHIIECALSCTIPYSTAPIAVTIPFGHAVVITYESNSTPNPVTGKQYRLEDLRFEFFEGGEEVALTLSGPVGSDNVDPWRLVSESFRWR